MACIEESSDTIFSKFCDINPSYSATFDNGERFGKFKIPISWFDPPLPCVYIIYQDSKPVYVGKTRHLGERFHRYANSWDWPSTDIRTDHGAKLNKKILAGAEAGHRFELWIRRIKDESERVVVEKDTIHRKLTKADWNDIMYEGKKRNSSGFASNDNTFYEWAEDRMPFYNISSNYNMTDDKIKPEKQRPTLPMNKVEDDKEEVHPPDTGSWITSAESNTATASTGFDLDEEHTKRSKEEVHPPDPPRICPKCGYHVPADSKSILCPCGKWVL